jgi:hypothetical protein
MLKEVGKQFILKIYLTYTKTQEYQEYKRSLNK